VSTTFLPATLVKLPHSLSDSPHFAAPNGGMMVAFKVLVNTPGLNNSPRCLTVAGAGVTSSFCRAFPDPDAISSQQLRFAAFVKSLSKSNAVHWRELWLCLSAER
jgi:hypothetical protein